jgi:hypothetical protein
VLEDFQLRVDVVDASLVLKISSFVLDVVDASLVLKISSFVLMLLMPA